MPREAIHNALTSVMGFLKASGGQSCSIHSKILHTPSLADIRLVRLRARLESDFFVVGLTRFHFGMWCAHGLTHNLTAPHAQSDTLLNIDLLTPSLQHGD